MGARLSGLTAAIPSGHPVGIKGAMALAAWALAALSCGSEPSGPVPDSALSCPDLSSRYFGDTTDDGLYRVVSPNGGETYRIGDSLTLRVTSGPNDSEAVVDLAFTANGSTTFLAVPGRPLHSLDTRDKCTLTFKIPDSLAAAGGNKVSLVSDSVRVRIAKYNFGTIQDYSDGYFRITE